VTLHRPPPPPQFTFDDDAPFVMHYAPAGVDAAGRVGCLGFRACDGGPIGDTAGADAKIRLFQDSELYVPPRWASANVPHAVTCEACRASHWYLSAVGRESPPEQIPDAEVAAAFKKQILGTPSVADPITITGGN
jgi:hypothetical protein